MLQNKSDKTWTLETFSCGALYTPNVFLQSTLTLWTWEAYIYARVCLPLTVGSIYICTQYKQAPSAQSYNSKKTAGWIPAYCIIISLGHTFSLTSLLSLVPRPLLRKAERGSGVLIDISCHMGRGLRRKECHIYILHPGLEFSDYLDCCTVWFTKTW